VSQIVDRAHGSRPLPSVLSGVLWARPWCLRESQVGQHSSIGQFGFPVACDPMTGLSFRLIATDGAARCGRDHDPAWAGGGRQPSCRSERRPP